MRRMCKFRYGASFFFSLFVFIYLLFSPPLSFQSHPNVDKELFRSQGLISLRQKAFPLNSSVGVLKYRRTSPKGDGGWPPLVLNCWPNGANCNIELVANRPLTELTISIP